MTISSDAPCLNDAGVSREVAVQRFLVAGAVAFTLLVRPLGANAADLSFLSELLFSAYEVMNYSIVCMQKDPEFLAQTSGMRGSPLAYAEHVKDETIATLPPEDVTLVLRTAALSAKIVSVRTFRRLDSTDRQKGDAQILEWCTTRGRSFVREFIGHHDTNHQVILEAIKRASE